MVFSNVTIHHKRHLEDPNPWTRADNFGQKYFGLSRVPSCISDVEFGCEVEVNHSFASSESQSWCDLCSITSYRRIFGRCSDDERRKVGCQRRRWVTVLLCPTGPLAWFSTQRVSTFKMQRLATTYGHSKLIVMMPLTWFGWKFHPFASGKKKIKHKYWWMAIKMIDPWSPSSSSRHVQHDGLGTVCPSHHAATCKLHMFTRTLYSVDVVCVDGAIVGFFQAIRVYLFTSISVYLPHKLLKYQFFIGSMQPLC